MLLRDSNGTSDTEFVVLDAGELDTAAHACAGDSVEALQCYLTLFGAADGVEMPAEVQGRVRQAVQSAARDLFDLSNTFNTLAEQLRRKAEQTRRAEGDTSAALAMEFAPILHFAKGEGHLLEDPQYFLKHTRKDGDYRDLVDNRYHRGDNSRARNLYEWDPIKRRLTYWFFYAYNDGTNNHEGDWERVTIKFDKGGAPEQMLFSSHKKTTKVAWKDVEKDPLTGQPNVFVAKGSHAVFHKKDDHPIDLPLVGPRIIKTKFGDIDDNANGDGRRLDLSQRPAADVREENWYPENGKGIHWGDDSDNVTGDVLRVFPFGGDDVAKELAGPQGPSPDKSHLE